MHIVLANLGLFLEKRLYLKIYLLFKYMFLFFFVGFIFMNKKKQQKLINLKKNMLNKNIRD